MKKKLLAGAAGLGGMLMLMTGLSWAYGPGYTATLTAEANMPPGPSGATGAAKVYIKPDAGRICQVISYENTLTPLTLAHIHVGEAGVNGPVVVDFKVVPSGEEQCFDADKAVLGAIAANPAGYYVNLHTALFPSGVLRGQLAAIASAAPPATPDPAPAARRERSRASRVTASVPAAPVG